MGERTVHVDPRAGRLAPLGRRAATPLGTLALAAVAAAACGCLVHRHGYVVLAAITSAAGVGVAWPWLALRSVRATLAFTAERGREGEPSSYRLTLRNRGPLPISGLALVGLGAGDVRLPTVGAFRTADAPLCFVPPCRGTYPPGPARLNCGLPFGLWHPSRPVWVNRSLLVWPAAAAVQMPVELRGLRSVEMAVAAASHSAGDEADGVRPYRRGDAVKLIHQRQTARHNRLIVRELIGAVRPAVRIALDTAEAAYVAVPDVRERAIRVAAGLCAACAEAGVDVDLVVEGRLARAGREAMDALARVGSLGGPAAHELLALAACRARGRTIVLVTSPAAGQRMQPGSATVVFVDDEPTYGRVGRFGQGRPERATR